ncbi:MAG: T9SS type A sorting domain-containing protein [Bacteroidia bacterium]
MKILLTSLAILVYKLAVCQIYYNKNVGYDSLNLYNGYTNMFIDNDTIFCLGFNHISNGTARNISKFDNEASQLIVRAFSEDSTSQYNGSRGNNLMKFGNSFIATGSSQKLNNNYDGLVLKFDNECDTLWVKKRSKSTADGTVYRYSVKTSESTFVTLGDVTYYNSSVNFNFGQIYLVKFDTLANIIWEHELGNPGTVSEFVKGIYPAADGGFFIYGYVTGYQQWSQCYLLKVDSMGNQVWQRSWGDIYWDQVLGLYEMPNGNLLVSGTISSDFFGLEVSNAYLAMLTPDGSQRIWEKRLFNTIDFYALQQIFKNQDGTYHIWGEETTSYITRPFLMHFSANFDSLDTKYYSYWNGPGAQNYIRDIVKMPDQGYVACGFGWDNNSDQDGWLLRIDSDGCANLNCTPLAIQENKNNIINDVAIYPNPATDKIYIKTNATEVIKSIRLLDISGTAIKAQITGNEIDVSMLANGLYIIEITNAQGNKQRLKALKE